jgi:fructoselysine transporter
LYPLPVIFSVLIWLFVFYSTGKVALLGLLLTLFGVVAFYLTKNLWKKDKTISG